MSFVYSGQLLNDPENVFALKKFALHPCADKKGTERIATARSLEDFLCTSADISMADMSSAVAGGDTTLPQNIVDRKSMVESIELNKVTF